MNEIIIIDFFNDVYKITLPEGEVKTVHNNNNNLLWQKVKIYGVSWSGGTSPSMTRTDDSKSFTSPVIGKGITKGSSPIDGTFHYDLNGNGFEYRYE